jgi:hypothetical protein
LFFTMRQFQRTIDAQQDAAAVEALQKYNEVSMDSNNLPAVERVRRGVEGETSTEQEHDQWFFSYGVLTAGVVYDLEKGGPTWERSTASLVRFHENYITESMDCEYQEEDFIAFIESTLDKDVC